MNFCYTKLKPEPFSDFLDWSNGRLGLEPVHVLCLIGGRPFSMINVLHELGLAVDKAVPQHVYALPE
jgi:hypothetical protein